MLFESLKNDVELTAPGKAFLTIKDVSTLLECEEKVIFNWTKRPDPKRRPPKLIVGKSFRFPKTEFLKWLAQEMSGELE